MSSDAELDTAPKAEREFAENVEIFFCRSALLHDGHSGAGDELRTSFSNSLPQARHWYSNMGMADRSLHREVVGRKCQFTTKCGERGILR